MKNIFLIIIIALMIMPIVTAKQGHMVLLAVKDTSNGYIGSTADLYLEIQPGNGRVFIETFPLSKLDTQISTRFAKEVACNYLEENCDKYDFFYTIKSESAIIGGPSAGGAIAVLTATVLTDAEKDETTAMTGTINAGGLIGPVSGLKEKIESAKSLNLTKVLIPKGERTIKEENKTTDLVEIGKEQGIKVIEVGDLTEALYEFTGKRYKDLDKELVVDEGYEEIMKQLAQQLCERTKNLQEKAYEKKILIRSNKELLEIDEQGKNLSSKSEEAYDEKRYYSSASYCFGANILYQDIIIQTGKEPDADEIKKEIEELNRQTENIEIETITDLETYMIIKERLKDAKEYLEKTDKTKEDYHRELAKSTERINSARSWANFFKMKGKKYTFDNESLQQGCMKKLSEAEERYHYAKLFFPNKLEETKKELDLAYKDFKKGDYELCMFKATKAKAEVGIILSLIGVGEDQVNNLIANKMRVVKRVLVEQQEKGVFPILGYSYYEYANSLDDISSKLLYSEYALELSNLDMYFKEKEMINIETKDLYIMTVFLSGAIFGAAILVIIQRISEHKTHANRPKPRLRGKKR